MSARRLFGEAVVGIALGAAVLGFATGKGAVYAAIEPPAEVEGSFDHDRAVPAHAVNVVDYTLHAVLDPATHVVHGEGTVVWRNTSSAAVRELWLHLYLNAFKNERTVFLRAPLRSGRGSTAPADWGYIDVRKLVARELEGVDLWPGADKTTPGDADDETDIRVPLPREIRPGEVLTLETAWDAKLPAIVERTGYAQDFHMVAQWFPKLARLEANGTWRHFPFYHLTEFYADFGTYHVTIDVPEGTVVGATGSRVGSTSENGREKISYRQSDVHDFAWTAWPKFREKTAHVDGIEIRALYPPGYDAPIKREIAAVTFGLPYFGRRYGPYPYRTLTIVHPPSFAGEAGGMEYPTLITTGGTWYGPPFLRDVEAVTFHELAHQYFYGLIATDEQRWPVLDEGISSFVEADALSAAFGAGSVFEWMGLQVGTTAVARATALRATHNEPVAQPAERFATGSDYAALVYGRTTAVLETMSGVYGRAKVIGAIGRYARRYRFGHPTLLDFTNVMREELGDAAVNNLEVALLQKGWVDYWVAEAASKRDEAPAGVFDRDGTRQTVARGTPTASIWQGTVLLMRHGTLKFPVEVEMWGADGAIHLAHWDGADDWIRLPYRGESELARVVVDPAGAVKLDENLFNNAYSIVPKPKPLRTLERATYVTELVLHWLMP